MTSLPSVLYFLLSVSISVSLKPALKASILKASMSGASMSGALSSLAGRDGPPGDGPSSPSTLHTPPPSKWVTLTAPLSTYPPPTPWSQSSYANAKTLYSTLTSSTDPTLSPLIKASLSSITSGLRLYGPTKCILSYNGGKDACVILHLYVAALAHYYSSNSLPPLSPICLYFTNPNEFPEVTSLLHSTCSLYDFQMLSFENHTFQAGLTWIVNHQTHLSFVLGTRSSDPNALNQETFAPSSPYMPPFLRINPILNWTYGDVWKYMKTYDVQYCELYDKGYTSLGDTNDTVRNPSLVNEDGTTYKPAYELKEWEKEREGRIEKKHKTKEKS